MSGRFLRSAFRVIDFPASVVPRVLASYTPHYAEPLAYNQSLGDYGSSLVSPKLPVEALAELIGAGNRGVLNVVLASREHRHEALARLLRTWRLSPADQLRFINRELGAWTRSLLLEFDYFEYEILGLADIDVGEEDALLGKDFIDGAAGTLFGEPGETTLRGSWAPWKSMFNKSLKSAEESLDASLLSFAENTDVALSALSCVEPSFHSYLGKGTNPVDVRAWQLFLGLAEGDPDVALRSVLQSARRLAVAESCSS